MIGNKKAQRPQWHHTGPHPRFQRQETGAQRGSPSFVSAQGGGERSSQHGWLFTVTLEELPPSSLIPTPRAEHAGLVWHTNAGSHNRGHPAENALCEREYMTPILRMSSLKASWQKSGTPQLDRVCHHMAEAYSYPTNHILKYVFLYIAFL